MRYWPVYGGGETVTATLANEFVNYGYTVHVVYSYEHCITPMPYVINDRIRQHQMHTIDGYSKNDVDELHDYIVKNHIDIMINQWGSVRLCNIARKGTACKLIMCWHQEVLTKFKGKASLRGNILKALHLYEWNDKRWKIKVHKRNTDNCDKYVFLTQSFANLYLQLSNEYNKSKIEAISNPLTYSTFYDIDNYHKKEKVILFVGRMEEISKRVSYVLNIWKLLCQDQVSNGWRLVMVGDGPNLSTTKELAQSMRLFNVSFEGYRNPKPYYEMASIFVMTSASEGFGMTLLEAQQNACVPLAMDTYSSLHDIIQDGENGFIIPDNDYEGYVSKIKLLMESCELRKKMAINGISSSRRFSKSSIVNQWESLFNELVEK